jgi:Plant transposon protein
MDSSSDDSSGDSSTDGSRSDSSSSSSSSSNAMEWSDDEFDMMAVAVLVVVNNNIAITNSIANDHHQQMINDVIAPNQQYRNGPRRPKALFRHHEALHCIRRDYLGIPGDLTTPIFKDRNFEMMFRLSRTRVQKIFEDVMHSGNRFYASQYDGTGAKGASLEAKILLPLKTMAYGTASHAFCDYFQMSKPLAVRCCDEYACIIKDLYSPEYLRVPDENDLIRMCKLHRAAHGVNGMMGSLDCMHTHWKNCPKAWQASYKSGKESGGPTVVLEAMCDYHLWFWHASFGYAGSLNDLNILNLSPFLECLVDGSFKALEEAAGIVPFDVGGENFNALFALVDGIYPRYSRFVKGIPMPVTAEEIAFSAWQESCRKDIERAFGVLQCRFQVMARPFHAMSLVKMSNTVSACLIMHNMAVSDRVMEGNVHAVYDPCANVFNDGLCEDVQDIAENNAEFGAGNNENQLAHAAIGIANAGNEFIVQNMIARQENWRDLSDTDEHGRLHAALMRFMAIE